MNNEHKIKWAVVGAGLVASFLLISTWDYHAKTPIPPEKEYSQCREIEVVRTVGLRYLHVCTSDDPFTVWRDNWGRWDTPGTLEKKYIKRYMENRYD